MSLQRLGLLLRRPILHRAPRFLSTTQQKVEVHQHTTAQPPSKVTPTKTEATETVVKTEACGDIMIDDEMEQEDMFVEAHESFAVRGREWGGPRRGGRFPEPTRYGDWERKGRCSDF